MFSENVLHSLEDFVPFLFYETNASKKKIFMMSLWFLTFLIVADLIMCIKINGLNTRTLHGVNHNLD